MGVQEDSVGERLGAAQGRAASSEPSDGALIQAHLAGDAQAFTLLVRRYKDRVYAAAFRVVHDPDAAAEIAQETFVRAHRKLGGFRAESSLYTWLYRIAVNLAKNRLRDNARKGRDKGVSLEAMEAGHGGLARALESADANPGEAAAAQELRAILWECLDALAEHYREAFVLRVIEGAEYAEIAAALNIPGGTVKSRMNAARKQLAACLDKKGYPLGKRSEP